MHSPSIGPAAWLAARSDALPGTCPGGLGPALPQVFPVSPSLLMASCVGYGLILVPQRSRYTCR